MMVRCLTAVVCALPMTLPARADETVVARWIQLAPNAEDPARPEPEILARVLVTEALPDDAHCPPLRIDGTAAPMHRRYVPEPRPAKTDGARFVDATECEAVVPSGHRVANLAGVDLRLPVEAPRRIVVLADTGCRMKGNTQQDCNDPTAFPIAFVARYAASFAPDLIIHVGDYFYRDDNACTPDAARGRACPDVAATPPVPWGDNWESWSRDWFAPAAPLLQAAPIVALRGNHESCGRGAYGWFYLLDPRPFDAQAAQCAKGSAHDFTPSYVVPLGGADLLVHDSSYANDGRVDADAAARYRQDLGSVLQRRDAFYTARQAPVPPAIFATHKPTFGLVRTLGPAGLPPQLAGNDTEQFLFRTLFGTGVPQGISLFLSGHIHQVQYVNFADNTSFAPQLIVGVGGSQLDEPLIDDVRRYDLPLPAAWPVQTGPASTENAPVTGAYGQAEFGFAVLDAVPGGYVAQVYSMGGQAAARCSILLNPPMAAGDTPHGPRRSISCRM